MTPIEAFKQLIWDVVLGVVVGQFTAILPGWLSWLSPLVLSVVSAVGDKIFAGLKMWLDFENIRIKNDELRVKYNAASVALKLIALEQGADSEAFKKARDEHKKALSALVQFAPSR